MNVHGIGTDFVHVPKISWQPSATIDNLRYRAKIIQKIRAFFYDRGYLEVDTPIMGQCGVTDVNLHNITASCNYQQYYLQTSPEYHMKRLLAADSGPIFQIAHVFRNDELGSWHNPEFTLLEWYHLDIDHHVLMQEVDEFLQHILNCPPLIKQSYQQLFIDICQFDPMNISIYALQNVIIKYKLDNILDPNDSNQDNYLFLLLTHIIEPYLKTLTAPIAIYDFPPTQAALAQIHNDVAERFEIYYQGIELANGFHELTDGMVQRQRFEHDIKMRRKLHLSIPPIDNNFLAALDAGLPNCSGIAIGVDRLIACVLKTNSIATTMAFDISRA